MNELPASTMRQAATVAVKRAPSTLRETFSLFKYYRPRLGLASITEYMDFTDVSGRQIYYATHGRAPDSVNAARISAKTGARAVFEAALKSPEFRENVVRRFLCAFPEKPRLFFLHIPKCAGTDLSARLTSFFASVDGMLAEMNWLSFDDLCLAVKHLVLETAQSEYLYVYGHGPISMYDQWRVLRLEDSVFTVIREPVARTISHVNYIVNSVLTGGVARPDTRRWRDILGLDEQAIGAGLDPKALARRVLGERRLIRDNPICHQLGTGTAASAIEKIVIHDIEVTEVNRYDDWCRQRWGVTNPTRRNVGERRVLGDDLAGEDLDQILSINDEDVKLFDRVEKELKKSGKPSIRGGRID